MNSLFQNGDIKKIEGVLKHRNEILVNLDARDNETGNTSLIWAAKRGYVQVSSGLILLIWNWYFPGAPFTNMV